MASREELLPGANDERRFVIVEPSPMPQERGDLLRPTGPQELGLSECRDRCIRCPRSGLDRNQAETKLLEETFVPLASGATEFLAAHTVVRMVDLINQLEKPGASSAPEQRQEYTNKLTRYIATKEQHSEIAKNEVRILWGDYFKPEHVKTFPELHELVWKALKSGSKARQEISLPAAEDLLKATNDIASIFWKTKGFETITAKAPYPTERLTVYPKFK